jgi:invasion protein IalB
VVAKLKTGSQGTFDIQVMPEQYEIEISLSGFEKTVQKIDVTSDLAPLSFSIKSHKR